MALSQPIRFALAAVVAVVLAVALWWGFRPSPALAPAPTPALKPSTNIGLSGPSLADPATEPGAHARLKVELEWQLLLAARELAWGNPAGARQLLEKLLARVAGDDSLSVLAQALKRDLEQLRLNTNGREEWASVLNRMALESDNLPLKRQAQPQRPNPPPSPSGPNSGWQEFSGQLQSLIRVQRVGDSEARLLDSSEEFFLRESLKLRLLSARLALLNRWDDSLRHDLRLARDWLQRHADLGQADTARFLDEINHLIQTPVAEPATLEQSFSALSQLR